MATSLDADVINAIAREFHIPATLLRESKLQTEEELRAAISLAQQSGEVDQWSLYEAFAEVKARREDAS